MIWLEIKKIFRRRTLKTFQSDPHYPSMGVFLVSAKTYAETKDEAFRLATIATYQALPSSSRKKAVNQFENEARAMLDWVKEPRHTDGDRRDAEKRLRSTLEVIKELSRVRCGLEESNRTAEALAAINPALKEAIDRTDLEAVKSLSPTYQTK